MPLLPLLRRAALLALAAVGALSALQAETAGIVRPTGLEPSVVSPLPTRDLDDSPASFTYDVRAHFAIGDANPDQLVVVKTSLGSFAAELLVADAPLTAANFRAYLATDATSAADKLKTYDNTFFHRAAENRDAIGQLVNEFVIQGGGYRVDDSLSPLAKKPTVANEFKVANTRGTLAMAKIGGQPDSATNEWFVNLADNRENLDNQNGGFTAFARILGHGMEIADAIAELPTYDLGGAFNELPLRDVTAGQTELKLTNLVAIESIRATPLQPPSGSGASVLAYTVSTDNPRVATATINRGILTITRGDLGGRARLTVRATEPAGAYVESALTVTRYGAPRILTQPPANLAVKIGQPAVIEAKVAAWPLNVRWQTRANADAAWTDIESGSDGFTIVATTTLKLALPAATPTQAGTSLAHNGRQIRYVVFNSLDGDPQSATSSVCTLGVTGKLAFASTPPATVAGKLGEKLTLTATPDPLSLPAPTLQWQQRAPGGSWENIKNTTLSQPTLYQGVTQSTLTIGLDSVGAYALAARDLDGHEFRCVLAHNRGSGTIRKYGPITTLDVASLPVAIDTPPPTSASGLIGGNVTISLVAAPAASTTPLSFQWQRRAAGTSEWVDLVNSAPTATPPAPTRYTGVNTRSLTVSLAASDDDAKSEVLALTSDRYRCVLSNVLGTVTSRATTLRVAAAAFDLLTHQERALHGLVPAEGRTFSASGLPPGIVINRQTGLLSGVSGAAPGLTRVSITIKEDGETVRTRAYYLQTRALSGPVVGGFEAFLADGDNPPYGKLALRISSLGAVTGTVTTRADATPVALLGIVRRSADGDLSLAAPLTLSRPGTPEGRTYALDFAITAAGVLTAELESGDTTYTAGSDQPGTRLAAYTTAAPAPWFQTTPAYTLAFTPPVPIDGEDSSTPLPQGGGYATGTIAATGKITLKGKLADGSLLTASLSSDVNADYRLFVQPQGGLAGAWFSAFLPLTSSTVAKPGATDPTQVYARYALAAADAEEVYWQKPASTTAATYRQGFGPVGLNVRMEPWNATNFNQLGVASTSDSKVGRVNFVISGSALSNTGTNPSRLPTSLAVTYATSAFISTSTPDPTGLTAVLDPKTGLLTGSFVAQIPARIVKFEGVFFTAPATRASGSPCFEGFALVPGSSTPTSCRVQFKAP